MTTFWCPSDILITSWLFTARWCTWHGNHLVPCVAELVGSCIPIHAHRFFPDSKCLFYPSGLSLCLSVDQFCLVPVDDIICDSWLVSYTALPCPGCSGLWLCVPAVKESTSFLCSLILKQASIFIISMIVTHKSRLPEKPIRPNIAGRLLRPRAIIYGFAQTELPACLSNVWAGAVLARHTTDQFGLLFILDLILRMHHKVP